MKYLVSVIVPVYNTARYLADCIDSLLAQTMPDLEIVIVDDGSTDDSSKIAESYALYHESIKVIRQSNQGLGPARNSGLLVARGEYVGFVDSDDWVEGSMFRDLYDLAVSSHADICFSGISFRYEQGQHNDHIHPLAGRTLNEVEDVNEFHLAMWGGAFGGESGARVPISCWNALYRKAFLDDHHLRFRNMRSEDRDFNIRCTRKAKCVAFDVGCGYCYRKFGQASITNGLSDKAIDDCLSLHDALMVELENESDEWRQECWTRLMGTSTEAFLDLFQAIATNGLEKSEQRRLMNHLMSEYALRGIPVKGLGMSSTKGKRFLLDYMRVFGPGITRATLERYSKARRFMSRFD